MLELEGLRNHFYHFYFVDKWASSLPLMPWAKGKRVSPAFTGLNHQEPASLLLVFLLHAIPVNIWWHALGMLLHSHLNLYVHAVSICSISVSFVLVPNTLLFLQR